MSEKYEWKVGETYKTEAGTPITLVYVCDRYVLGENHNALTTYLYYTNGEPRGSSSISNSRLLPNKKKVHVYRVVNTKGHTWYDAEVEGECYYRCVAYSYELVGTLED